MHSIAPATAPRPLPMKVRLLLGSWISLASTLKYYTCLPYPRIPRALRVLRGPYSAYSRGPHSACIRGRPPRPCCEILAHPPSATCRSDAVRPECLDKEHCQMDLRFSHRPARRLTARRLDHRGRRRGSRQDRQRRRRRTPRTGGVRAFKGIPFAAPPVGDLRWKAPQPVKNWTRRSARPTQFGPRCMQRAVFGDMNFRSNGMSEDCLYLNVWTPAKSAQRAAAGAGLLLRRRLRRRRRLRAALRRREHGAQGHRRAHRQLPARRVRLLRPSGADQGIAAARVGQLWAARPGGRAALGAAEHRRVRRRSQEGHDRRRVGRLARRSAR